MIIYIPIATIIIYIPIATITIYIPTKGILSLSICEGSAYIYDVWKVFGLLGINLPLS